jgi:hypothetical protein
MDYEMQGGEEDVNSRERRSGMAMGEPHARCCQEELTPGEGRRQETRGNLERMGHAGAMMMPALKTPRLSLNLLKWLYSHSIVVGRLDMYRTKVLLYRTMVLLARPTKVRR